MAYTKLMLENPHNGKLADAPVGFSWTTLFFGFFPALFRGDWKWAVILFIIACITWGLSNIIFAFIYNKLYIRDLVNSGYRARGNANNVAASLGFEIPSINE
ncbi:hypothetical protein [Photobacterium leiognathi]|uniref:hypothetical protein n=1 Tax=Photobacterium leiognathi TaxID=553611 RepID=UPI002735ED86|nr:hypothetical protein [Photobacterium leiognathi]